MSVKSLILSNNNEKVSSAPFRDGASADHPWIPCLWDTSLFNVKPLHTYGKGPHRRPERRSPIVLHNVLATYIHM
jgi:hypothetical protein